MRLSIGGKRWDVVFHAVPTGLDGQCDPPDTKGKQIRIAPRLRRRPQRLLTVLIHECLHAADWSKDEEWVEAIAEDISRVLWKHGFRKVESEDLPG